MLAPFLPVIDPPVLRDCSTHRSAAARACSDAPPLRPVGPGLRSGGGAYAMFVGHSPAKTSTAGPVM